MQGCITIFKNHKFLKMLAIRESQFSDRRDEKAIDGFFIILPGLKRMAVYEASFTAAAPGSALQSPGEELL
ncbi:MAG: hypothetical protein ACREVN_01535 [Gammaproteobacteria bacterium]